MRYLVTGHTGFKGSWLSAILKILGHEVIGVSLMPPNKSHYVQANISKYMDLNYFLDIKNVHDLKKVVSESKPDVIVHLAAQSLVQKSFKHPIETYNTNVIGSLNILEASKLSEKLKATLVTTTDKVYKNLEINRGYTELDALGGNDPYSSSKAAADIAVQSWRKSFGVTPISIARSGNVVGGGDWAENRLIPDLVQSKNGRIKLRNPNSIRPWQHVLDCLNGYLKLIDLQITSFVEGEWNFSPLYDDVHTVGEVVTKFSKLIGNEIKIDIDKNFFPEAQILLLDSSKSREQLNWSEKYDFDISLEKTLEWYQAYSKGEILTERQIMEYLSQ